LIVIGVVCATTGSLMAAAGGTLVWAHATQRDADGFYTSSMERFATSTAALTAAV